LEGLDINPYITGSAQPKLNQENLKSIWLPVPPINVQQAIVDSLDREYEKVDMLIANVQAQIEKLKDYRLSIVIEAVTKGLVPETPMMDSGVDWIGEIPATWNTIRVKQLLRERKERSVEGKEEPLSMSQKVGLVPTRMLDSIPNMASSFVGAKLTYVNDLVFNKLKAHLGVFSVSKYDGLVSPDYAVYYSTGVADLKYLEYLFKTPQCISEFRKRSTGIAAGLTRLYTDGLFAIECPLPPKDEQQEIVAYLDKKWADIDRLIAIKQAKIEKLEQYKRSLIFEYVTGKKEVTA
jgi:type I restriction enzyme S subunit